MSQDPMLEKMAFPFIRVAPRPSKPRTPGLTIVGDRGLGPNRVDDLMGLPELEALERRLIS